MCAGIARPSCLLVVDLQQQFINAHTNGIVAGIQARLANFDWVLCSRLVPDPTGPLARWKGYKPAPADAPGAQLALDLRSRDPARTMVGKKTSFGGLNSELRALLQREQIGEVHLCGVDTDLCVLHTAGDLLEKNFRPIVLRDLCASTAGPEQHRFGLAALRRMLGAAQMV